MARRDALLRLHKSLLARREDLRKKLADDLAFVRTFKTADSTGDSADVAFEAGSDEMTSQLAEFDSRELVQIDRALDRLKQGTYGVCECCGGKIPVRRLNALPYSTLCIECQREMEKYPNWDGFSRSESWERVSDGDSVFDDSRGVDLAQLEIDLSK